MRTHEYWVLALGMALVLANGACAQEDGGPVVPGGAGGGGVFQGFGGFDEGEGEPGFPGGVGGGGVSAGFASGAGQGGAQEGIPGGAGMGQDFFTGASEEQTLESLCLAFCDWYMTCEPNPYDICLGLCNCFSAASPALAAAALEITKYDCEDMSQGAQVGGPGMDNDFEEVVTPFDKAKLSDEEWEAASSCSDYYHGIAEFNWMFF